MIRSSNPKAIYADMGIIAMIGARLFLPSSNIGLIVDEGQDFPLEFKDQLNILGEGIYWREREGNTSRALNIYSGPEFGYVSLHRSCSIRKYLANKGNSEGHQTFQYIVPPVKIQLSDLVVPPSPFNVNPPEWVHVVVRHPRAREIVIQRKDIQEGKIEGVGKGWRPKLIWEPLDVQVSHESLWFNGV